MTAFIRRSSATGHSIAAAPHPRKHFSCALVKPQTYAYNDIKSAKGGVVLDTTALPSIFLHNFVAVIAALLLSIPLRIRWLITLIAWGLAIGVSFLWEQAGYDWHSTWKTYLHDPIFGGGLWHDSASEAEIFGFFLFWLMPLALAYMVALARIGKMEK